MKKYLFAALMTVLSGVAMSAPTVRLYIFTEYMDRTAVTDFEKETGIKVEYTEFETNEEALKNYNKYDIIVPSDNAVQQLITENKLQKINKSKIPNVANIAPEYFKVGYDADYIVPYMIGTIGILYNKRQIRDNIDSWESLFNPAYKGAVLMLESPREAIGLTLKSFGRSMNASDDASLEKAVNKLNEGRSVFGYNTTEEIRNLLVAGEFNMGVVYSGDARIASIRNPNLRYVIPKEGSNKWTDSFIITKDAKDVDACYKFIDFMCRPNVAVRNVTVTGYTSVVKGSSNEFRNNKIMFPAQEDLDRSEPLLYNSESVAKYNKAWQTVRRK